MVLWPTANLSLYPASKLYYRVIGLRIQCFVYILNCIHYLCLLLIIYHVLMNQYVELSLRCRAQKRWVETGGFSAHGKRALDRDSQWCQQSRKDQWCEQDQILKTKTKTRTTRPRPRPKLTRPRPRSRPEWQDQDQDRAFTPRLFVLSYNARTVSIIKTVSFQCIQKTAVLNILQVWQYSFNYQNCMYIHW